LSVEDFSWKKQKEYMDNLIRDLIERGKDINEIMDMPFNFMVDLMEERNKTKESKSLISAFGG